MAGTYYKEGAKQIIWMMCQHPQIIVQTVQAVQPLVKIGIYGHKLLGRSFPGHRPTYSKNAFTRSLAKDI